MPKLTTVHWKKFEKFLFYVGCTFDRTKGDHCIYVRDGLRRPIVVKMIMDLPVYIIKNNLRELDVSHNEYLDIINSL